MINEQSLSTEIFSSELLVRIYKTRNKNNPAFNLELLFVVEESSITVVEKCRHEQTGGTPMGFTPKVRK